MKIKLSLVVITYNEEKNIGRCLDSVKDVVDDIVVVDSYSIDRTEEICVQKGARFISHTFHSHIDQKNWAITQARYPHILSLDADEALSEQLRNSILEAKNNWKYDGYYFNRLNNYCGKWIRHTTWYPSRKLRLWDSRKGHWGGVNPHDKYILDPGTEMQYLKGDLLHYTFYNFEEHEKQVARFSSIIAQSYFDMGIRTSLVKRILHTSWRFMNNYIIRLGFLEGYTGFTISRLGARGVRLRHLKLRDLWREQRNSSSATAHK